MTKVKSGTHRNYIGYLRPIFLKSLLVVSLALFPFGVAHALRIFPERLVIKPDENIASLYIKNSSQRTKAYRFGWRHLAMTTTGEIRNIDKPGKSEGVLGYRPADDFIRYSPRQAVLKPGDTQHVTLLLRRSQDLEPGEYRSHFVVEEMPGKAQEIEETEKKEREKDLDTSHTNVGINLLVSRSFPVYVLHGETSATIKLTKAVLKKNQNKTEKHHPDHVVYLDIQKEGNRSVIGMAKVLCKSDNEEVQVTKLPKIFAVYAEAQSRQERIAVHLPPGGCKSMRIEVTAHKDDVLSGEVLGEIDVAM